MKRTLGIVAGAIALSACGEPAAVDPYATLAEDSLLVRFEANPEIAEGECNPNIHYAMRSADGEAYLLNANYEIVDESITGAGLAIFDDDETGIARNTIELSTFDPFPKPCAELHVKVQDLRCRLESVEDLSPCPNPVYEGTEMFASFRGLN